MTERIRFGEPLEMVLPDEKLPLAEWLIHHPDNEKIQSQLLQVYILESTLKQIYIHLSKNLHIETGGILVGHPFCNLDNPAITFVLIVGAIRQDTNNCSVGHFTVGPAEINASREALEKLYPGLVTVGWYHSHPGHGVFLSGQDMSIVRNIYNANWHIAMVMDPQQGEIGFFAGPEGERLSGWLTLKGNVLPTFVKAIGKYNYIHELLGHNKFKQAHQELIDLDQMILEPSMKHWQENGGYQDVPDILAKLMSQNIQQNLEPSSIMEDINEATIESMYLEAENTFRNAFNQLPPNPKKLKESLELFKTINHRSPEYKDVKQYINNINYVWELEVSQGYSRPNRNLLEHLLSKLGVQNTSE